MNPNQNATDATVSAATRVHLALPVTDLESSLDFYRALLEREPVKVKTGYAKIVTSNPPLNLSLNLVAEPPARSHVQHFGLEVASTEAVVAHEEKMRRLGFTTANEEGVTCCFSVQDKVWVVDPDGHRWEVFVVLDDAEVHSAPEVRQGRLESAGPAGETSSPGARRCCG
jgi:catechol 2,3-dioxygenase-like lactoylglutathione lyase family enzyme